MAATPLTREEAIPFPLEDIKTRSDVDEINRYLVALRTHYPPTGGTGPADLGAGATASAITTVTTYLYARWQGIWKAESYEEFKKRIDSTQATTATKLQILKYKAKELGSTSKAKTQNGLLAAIKKLMEADVTNPIDDGNDHDDRDGPEGLGNDQDATNVPIESLFEGIFNELIMPRKAELAATAGASDDAEGLKRDAPTRSEEAADHEDDGVSGEDSNHATKRQRTAAAGEAEEEVRDSGSSSSLSSASASSSHGKSGSTAEGQEPEREQSSDVDIEARYKAPFGHSPVTVLAAMPYALGMPDPQEAAVLVERIFKETKEFDENWWFDHAFGVRETGSCKVVADLLSKHGPSTAAIAHYGAHALMQLGASGNTTRMFLGGAGCAELLVELLKRYSDASLSYSDDPQASTLEIIGYALQRLAFHHSENADRLVGLDVYAALDAAEQGDSPDASSHSAATKESIRGAAMVIKHFATISDP